MASTSNNAASSITQTAAQEIENLCLLLRESGATDNLDLIVRGISARIEELSQAIMSAHDDPCPLEDIYYTVHRKQMEAN